MPDPFTPEQEAELKEFADAVKTEFEQFRRDIANRIESVNATANWAVELAVWIAKDCVGEPPERVRPEWEKSVSRENCQQLIDIFTKGDSDA